MSPAYLVVIGSAQSESVDAQLSLVRLNICETNARRSGFTLPVPGPGGATYAFSSSACGVPTMCAGRTRKLATSRVELPPAAALELGYLSPVDWGACPALGHNRGEEFAATLAGWHTELQRPAIDQARGNHAEQRSAADERAWKREEHQRSPQHPPVE
jgi:hypothetical protein